jgi:lipopolysaccharide assembly outer membrane protein LptD (OstA)
MKGKVLSSSKVVRTTLFLICAFLFIGSAISFAQDDDLFKQLKPGQPIIVDGDKVEYFEKEGKIVAEGNVSITHGDVKLTCNRIEVNTRTRQALCVGNVVIEQPEGTLTGERIRYDFAKREGEIIGGEVEAFPWFGRAEETAKVGENEYLLKKGYISTCDLDQPHYRIKAEEIQVFPDDKVIAKNVFFYIGKIPILWFPYYYHPIIQSRAKVQFVPGRSSEWGYFLLSAWRFYVRGNSRVDVLADYRSKKGFAEGANFYYNTADFEMPGLGEGMFRAYFIHQNDIGTYDPTPFDGEGGIDPRLRDRFQWKHRIDFDPDTVGMLEFNKVSDENVIRDYFYNEYEENYRVPMNYASIISAKQNYTLGIVANKRFNDFYTITEKMPEVKLDIPDQRLWNIPLYYSSEMAATMFDKEYASESRPSERVNRFDSFHKLSYAAVLGPIEFTPYGTFRGTAYSRTELEGQPVYRTTFGGGLDVTSRLYRIYDIKTDVMGLDINGVRHIFAPSARYFHIHQPSIDKDKLFQMDSIDSLEKQNGITLSLENKLQTKWQNDSDLETIDLVRFIVSVDYLFRMEKGKFKFEDGGEFNNLTFDLELRPYKWLYVESKMAVEPENETISTGSIEASLRPWDSFRMDMGYRYEKKTPEPRNQFTFDLKYQLNPKWRVGWYERFDLQRGSIEEQQVTITRDLHCWEVEVACDVKGGNFAKDDFTFWVVFRIKAFPDLPLGLNRSFSRRPPGAAHMPN